MIKEEGLSRISGPTSQEEELCAVTGLFGVPGMPSMLFAPKERHTKTSIVKQVNASVAAKAVRATGERGNIQIYQPFPC